MRFLSVESNDVTFNTFGSKDNTKRQAHPLEHRPLFDVQFKIGRGIFAFLR